MNVYRARALRVGDRVVWRPTGERGVIVGKSYLYVLVSWQDGLSGRYAFRAPARGIRSLLLADAEESRAAR